ncbi:PAS domain-containing protein [Raoultibacter phocaeensis]|uniref:PAS domain-containing protein n=1 Tax=Raoultibacter phocaeensis TaxID=2479841 RepID=UPI001C56AD4F|nr:PAS domain-containing protein [Raoultibacter phocaeensis]
MLEQSNDGARTPKTAAADSVFQNGSRSAQELACITEDSLLEEYNMLMSALHVSVSKHLFTERFEVVWANDFYYAMTGYTREEYERLFENCCGMYFQNDPEEYAKLSAKVMKAFEAGEPGYECLLHMRQKGDSFTWIHVVGKFTNELIDGMPVIYSTFTNVDDVVQIERERSIAYDNIPGFIARYRVGEHGLSLLYGNDRFAEFSAPSVRPRCNDCCKAT